MDLTRCGGDGDGWIQDRKRWWARPTVTENDESSQGTDTCKSDAVQQMAPVQSSIMTKTRTFLSHSLRAVQRDNTDQPPPTENRKSTAQIVTRDGPIDVDAKVSPSDSIQYSAAAGKSETTYGTLEHTAPGHSRSTPHGTTAASTRTSGGIRTQNTLRESFAPPLEKMKRVLFSRPIREFRHAVPLLPSSNSKVKTNGDTRTTLSSYAVEDNNGDDPSLPSDFPSIEEIPELEVMPCTENEALKSNRAFFRRFQSNRKDIQPRKSDEGDMDNKLTDEAGAAVVQDEKKSRKNVDGHNTTTAVDSSTASNLDHMDANSTMNSSDSGSLEESTTVNATIPLGNETVISTNQTTGSQFNGPLQQHSLVITGFPQSMPPGGPYRYPRFIGPGQQVVPQIQPPPVPSGSAVLIAELVISFLGTISRLWFLTWLAKRLAAEEESIQPTQHFVWERLNDRYQRDVSALQNVLQRPPLGVSKFQWYRHHIRMAQGYVEPEKVDLAKVYSRTVVVVELNENPKEGINFDTLSEVVTFILQEHRNRAFGIHKDTGKPMDVEVVFLVQSPGGSVATFGLAASQMRRLSNVEGITTTVCVDAYAASGGYMIASQAHKLLAAPFATLGSIGVIMEGLNFHELAQRYGIQPVILKAGTSKNPLSTFGPISNQDIKREEERLAKVHRAFQQLVVEGRPALAEKLAHVADGSVFLGKEAFDLQMIDGIQTSDEYILERINSNDRVLKLYRSYQARLPRRMSNLSPLDLLPHLQSWLRRIDGKQVHGLAMKMLHTGAYVGFAAQLLKSLALPNR